MRYQFKLKDPKTTGETSIRLLIYHKDFLPHGVLYYGTGQLIRPIYFDAAAQRPSRDKSLLKNLSREEQRDLQLLDDKLNAIHAAARHISEKLTFGNIPYESNTFRIMLDEELGITSKDINSESYRKKQMASKGNLLNEYLDKYIEDIKNGIRLTSGGNQLREGSLKNYLTFRSQFQSFQKEKRCKVNFADINSQFYNDFVVFLNKKEYSPNTIGKHIARLKKIMRSAKEDGIYNGSEHEKRYFKAIEVDTEHVYLTQEELNRIEALDLTDKPELDLHRDVFLIGCAIAQRVSDYKCIRPEQITKTSKGIRILKLHQQKTGEQVMIPIGAQLDRLLKKYNYSTPVIHEQKLNEVLKTIGSEAKIDSPIEIEMIRGGLKKKTIFKKFELIKSHTARRTGATNMYLAGIPPIDIMKITGHKKESNFLKYIRVTKEETADKLSNHAYFK